MNIVIVSHIIVHPHLLHRKHDHFTAGLTRVDLHVHACDSKRGVSTPKTSYAAWPCALFSCL